MRAVAAVPVMRPKAELVGDVFKLFSNFTCSWMGMYLMVEKSQRSPRRSRG